MPTLQETIHNTHLLLRNDKKPEELLDFFQTDIRRLSIYPSFVKLHITKFLSENFASLKSLFEPTLWKKIITEYFKKYPAQHWQLYRSAENFPKFIRDLMANSSYDIQEFHAELAELEWIEISTYNCDIPFPSGDSIQTPIINPTLSILNLTYPVARFAQLSRISNMEASQKQWLEKKEYLMRLPIPSIVFLFRNPKTQASNFIEVTDSILFAFKIVHDQLSPEQASQQSQQSLDDVHELINEIQQLGIVILPH